MDATQRQLGVFLRSLNGDELTRFCHLIGEAPPGDGDGSAEEREQRRQWRIDSIVAAKQNNPAYYEKRILPAFPADPVGQHMLRHMLSLPDAELLSFYREIMDKLMILYAGQRPQLTLQILDTEHADPACWERAKRRAESDGVHLPPDPQQELERMKALPWWRRPRSWSLADVPTLIANIVFFAVTVIAFAVAIVGFLFIFVMAFSRLGKGY